MASGTSRAFDTGGLGLPARLPILTTARMTLRPFDADDAWAVAALLDDGRIQETTAAVPYPYGIGLALEWIQGHETQLALGAEFVFALTEKHSGTLLGALGVRPGDPTDTLGWWIGARYWNQGYCSEAGQRIVQWCWARLPLEALGATHLARNPASGRVMEKIGMHRIGRVQRDFRARGRLEWFECYRIDRPADCAAPQA